MFLSSSIVKCNCNDDSIQKLSDTIDNTLIEVGNKLYLYQSYEVGNLPQQIDMFNLIFQRDQTNDTILKLCKLSYKEFHMEETYLEKYCHENDII